MRRRPIDSEPQETQDWVEALESSLRTDGPERAHFLIEALIERLPLHVHTAILDAVVIGGGVAMVVNVFMR